MDSNTETVQEIATLAQECNGLLFGGVVRDWLILNNKQRDIDIWFQNKADAEKFQVELKKAGFQTRQEYLEREKDELYHFDRINLCFKPKGTKDVFNDYCDWKNYLDLIISETFPVNDFENNMLVFDGVQIKHISGKEEDLQKTIILIQSRVMVPMAGYLEKTEKERAHRMRVDRLSLKGWKILNWDSCIKN